MIRVAKGLMLVSMALFFSLIAMNNLVDYSTNWKLIQHVLSMDTIHKNPSLSWRAITDKEVQHFAYCSLIVWQIITAIICWVASFRMLKNAKPQYLMAYKKAKKMAVMGLLLGFLLYMVAYIDVAGEWFVMWQSTFWNVQKTAGLFLTVILLVMIFVSLPETE